MALIQRPMYEHFAARHLAVKGPGALTNIEDGVMGVLPLDVMSDPAYWYPQGIRVFSATAGQGGVAGQYASVGLSIENANEEVLCRIISIDLTEGAGSGAGWNALLYRCARSAYSSDPGVQGFSSDTRIAEAQPSKGILVNGNHAANPGQILGSYHTTGEPDFLGPNRIPLIVSPLQTIYIAMGAQNTTLYCNFTWIEIPAYKAEL